MDNKTALKTVDNHEVFANAAARSKALRPLRLLLSSKTGTLGALMVLLVCFAGLFAPELARHDPAKVHPEYALLPPVWEKGGTWEFPLGTDQLGRDMLSRLLYGTRVSLIVGVCAVVVAGFTGAVIGLIAAFHGGWIDNVLMRIADAFLSIPSLLFTLVVIGVFGPGLLTLIFVIGATNWVTYARVVRGEALSVKEREFVKAARVIGVKDGVIIFRHLLPNVMSSFIVISTLSVATTIILEASLSFLGLGIQPPTVSWGGMLSTGRDYIMTNWWVATFPGLAITFTVLGIILLGDWLRDLLDPRIQNE